MIPISGSDNFHPDKEAGTGSRQEAIRTYSSAIQLQRKLNKWVFWTVIGWLMWATFGGFLVSDAFSNIIYAMLLGAAVTASYVLWYTGFNLKEQFLRMKVSQGLCDNEADKQFKKDHPVYAIWLK